jgi:uncharacterized protein (DUF1800 family)
MLAPFPGSKWSYEKGAHLLNRIGFGATPSQIETAYRVGLDGILREMVDAPVDTDDRVAAPAWAHPINIQAMRVELNALKQDSPERQEKMRQMREKEAAQIVDLRRWWLDRMMTAQNPLREKMTVFWHGHFATSNEKVQNSYWMWRQNETLRRNALGNFKSLTREMSRDPAMMIYLDLQESRKEHPNENWARELMELFTVGIGHYSEDDIRQSARAFTGYRIDMTTQQFQFMPGQHDNTPKNFMGKTGAWNGDDVIDILMEQPACAEFIARKLWRYFVEDDPPQKIVADLANRLRTEVYEIRPVLREIFGSAEFFSERVMHSQVKSPAQFLVQTTKLLQSELPPPKVMQNAMNQMGQSLFAPPNVKGWDGGRSWISPSTLLFRDNFANYLVSGDIVPRPPANPPKPKVADGLSQSTLVTPVPSSTPTPSPTPVASPTPPPEPRRPSIDIAKIVPPQLRDKPEELVVHLARRFFQRTLPQRELWIFTEFLVARKPDTGDETMRALLHLMMGTPMFQLT